MLYRDLYIGRWHACFVFAPDGYDDNAILDMLYDLDASDYILVKVGKKLRENRPNEGFTYANSVMKEALVVIGPTTSGAEFQDTFSHEIHHLAVAIAKSLGIDLESETPAYVAGDSTRELADVVCLLGCEKCNHEQ